MPNGEGRARGVEAAPRRLLRVGAAPRRLIRVSFVETLQMSSKANKRSSPADVKQNKRSRVCHRKIQNINQLPFGNDANFVNHPGAADIKIHPKSPEILLGMRYFCNFSLVSLGIRPRSRRFAERTRQGEGRWSRPPKPALERSYSTKNSSCEGRWSRPPKPALERSYLTKNSSSANPILRSRRKKNS